MPSYVRWASVALVLFAVAVRTAVGWTFQFVGDPVPPYTHEGYRPLPHWRIGVWDDSSVPAKMSTKKLEPRVEIDVVLLQTKRPSAQFFMYDVNFVERNVYANDASAHPCMIRDGTTAGVADLDRLGDNAIVITGYNTHPDGTDQDAIHIRAFAPIKKTGFYAFTFLTCRVIWRNRSNLSDTTTTQPSDPANWIAESDTGEEGVKVVGSVKVVNPYGEVPGQAYGFVPCFALLFVFLILNSLILAIRMCCAGRGQVVIYHWTILCTSLLTMFVCIFYVAYLGEINENNADKPGIYLAAYFFQRVRDAWARMYAGLMAIGLGVVRHSLTTKEKALSGTYIFVYILFGIIHIIVTESDDREVLNLSAIMRLRNGPMNVAVIVIDFILNLIVVIVVCWLAKRTAPTIEKGSIRRKLWFVTLAIFAVYTVIGFINASANVLNEEMHDRPYETAWKVWWFSAALMDIVFVITVILLTIVWFPREATNNLVGRTFADNANYDIPAGVGNGSGAGVRNSSGSNMRADGFQPMPDVDYGADDSSGGREMTNLGANAPHPAVSADDYGGGGRPPATSGSNASAASTAAQYTYGDATKYNYASGGGSSNPSRNGGAGTVTYDV